MLKSIEQILNNFSVPKKIREATAIVAPAMEKTDYPERVQYVYDFLDEGENGLALEVLCENLYEFSCPVPRKAYDLLEEAGTAMSVDSKYWEMLKPLIVSQ